MVDYPVLNPIGGVNGGLFPFEVANEMYVEWITSSPLSFLMGNSLTSPIVRHKFKPGEGLQYRVGLLDAVDFENPIEDFAQRRGNEQRLHTEYMSVNLKWRTLQTIINGLPILR